MKYVSLFSGAGGGDLGCDAAGWECVAQVEWDPKCQKVLRHHWPDVPKWEDVSHVDGARLPHADAVVFGSPCQDLSIAGRRAGLAGGRSGLFVEAVRIIREMRDASGGRFPAWVVWENVGGALNSSGGADFARVLDLLADAGALVLEWAVLDARRFGVPQRRRRVFVVACFDPRTAESCPDPLLPVGPRVPGSARKGDETGQIVAALTANGVGAGGGPDDNAGQAGHLIATQCHGTNVGPMGTLRAGNGNITGGVPFIPVPDSTGTITSNWSKGPGNTQLEEGMLVPFVKAKRAQTDQDDESWVESSDERPAPTLNAMDNSSESRATVITVGGDLAVRRLTPRECERLMGWPDDHTLVTNRRGKPMADSSRYRMIGNGIASPVLEWVCEQINRAAR